MTEPTTTTDKPRRGIFALYFGAPTRPGVSPDLFTGLTSLEETKRWMDMIYRFDTMDADGAIPIRVVTICGSGRFRRELIELTAKLSHMGFIVLTAGNFAAGNILETPSPIDKAVCDAAHLAKIRMSDAVVVIDARVDGKPYIGESTARQIEWAESLGKPVFYTGDLTDFEFTKPQPELWGQYRPEQQLEKCRWLQGILDGMYDRTPAAMLEKADSLYVPDHHDEYGWGSKIDENDIAENADTFSEGSRHPITFNAELGEAVLVIDQNRFDEGLGRQVVVWHLERHTEVDRKKRDLAFAERMAELKTPPAADASHDQGGE